ncbi:MAG: CoA-transferase [Alphaproteobacteria bacterium]
MDHGNAEYSNEELLIAVVSRLLLGARHIAVGVLSPIPGSAAILAQARSETPVKVSIIGSRVARHRTDGGVDFFDCAGQGRLDAFFLSGGQIDGNANINLLGVGDYPGTRARWSGSFGSAYLYFVVPKVILFREEHTKRTLVEKVDIISAPGTSPANVYRPGGPHALVTSRCLFMFDKERGGFRLQSLHPGVSLEEVRDNTGFDFACPDKVPETPAPDAATLELIRGEVAGKIADPYPKFAREVLDFGAAASG